MNPVDIFLEWYNQELILSKEIIPSACCLSTIGLDGFPNARFVSLKEVKDDAFIVTGPITSRKGLEIKNSNKIALTFWWSATKKQIRVQGVSAPLNPETAEKYFNERDRSSQIISVISDQGNLLENKENLRIKFNETFSMLDNQEIKRPENWGGYTIKPIRIELMSFEETRFHDRDLYELKNGKWLLDKLQP